ncbi:hypothetical protein EYB53_024125 [Candidatus Chloroploca sp. M-50]|uniref:Gingipain domain-containing protein n=1 Tax=Candidatus Chloroploca mongolica TaxID=2528176 RepID=A0ABS4DHB0_9CHLR|nr:hypothetical protein [Candidatus Chloroploca mongolica]
MAWFRHATALRSLAWFSFFVLFLTGTTASATYVNPTNTLVREGWLRGQQVRVFDAGNGALHVEVVGAGRVTALHELATLTTTPFATGAPPPDPAAAQAAWHVHVTKTGMQRLPVASLVAAGFPLEGVTNARLMHRGNAVALEEVRDAQGTLVELRFYAEPGDRWSDTAIFWLTSGATPGLRMAHLEAQPGPASLLIPIRTTALERGTWRENTIYESRLPGHDGDHFFSRDLRVAAGGGEPEPPVPPTYEVPLQTHLPAAPGPVKLTVEGDTFSREQHTLEVRLADHTVRQQWSGSGLWAVETLMPTRGPTVTVALLPGIRSDRVHVDAVSWQAPVTLDLAQRGATFLGETGKFIYQLNGQPTSSAVYLVDNRTRPVRLHFTGPRFMHEASTPGHYLVTGDGTLHTPELRRTAPVDLAQPLNAEALYLAPQEFLAALEPLLAHRRSQGHTVAAVATEAIYATWSHGQLDPEAIRSFLRYAAETWAVAPTSVILVGDGSSDPRNYFGFNQPIRVPPYLAFVDPWLGETACDTCYVQLHGNDPRSDSLQDMWIGRLPAKSVVEVEDVVNKILTYEETTSSEPWQSTIAYIADNNDLAGDFAQAVAESAALHPAGLRLTRMLYDPAAPPGDPWRKRDPLVARDRTMQAFRDGAAIVHYIGHGLQYQWAYTGPPLNPGEPDQHQYLLGLFDVDSLGNQTRLPVVLSMSCLTGSFQIPASRGTSIDERLVIQANGGAIAAWSSTGLGVLYGHDALQRGFYRALWAAPRQASLGHLTLAGSLELFGTTRCCQASLRTFVLLGDPLTIPQIYQEAGTIFLPVVGR